MPVPAAIALAPAALGFISNAAKAVGAGSRLKKDKSELAQLTPAFYKIQDEYEGNRNSAAEIAQGGITPAAKDYYTEQSQRGFGSGVSAITSSGGNPNDIARIFDSYNQGIRKIGADDAEAQINNIKYFHQVNKDLAAQKNIQWGVNEYEPYRNKLKELTLRIAADKTNINNAVNGAIGSFQAGVTSMQNNSLLKSLYGDGKGGVADPVANDSITDFSGRFGNTFGVPDAYSNNNTGENYGRPDAVAQMQQQQQRQPAPAMSDEQISQLMTMLEEMRATKEPQ